MRRITAIIVTASVLIVPASAVASTRHYVPKPGHSCRPHYVRRVVKVRVRKHGKVVRVRRAECLYVKPKPAPPTTAAGSSSQPTIHYTAKVDPSFTQSPSDPMAVTYGYSADATSTSNGVTTDLATADNLPSGILNFYSQQTPNGPESLFCSMNVGGSTDGGSCPITYPDTGQWQVTTQYIPNAAAATTETDTETVSPYTTTTTVSDSITGGITFYTPSVVDQVGNVVQFSASELEYVITDATTGHVLGTVHSAGYGNSDVFFFELGAYGTSWANAICETVGRSSCTGPIVPPDQVSDSFTAQAVYSPQPGAAWSGSSGQTILLAVEN